ncbi:hypothetical protein [Duganella sp. S19_KUP01_CR8]|uniref:hypothetical protein n=1 Tax=Duganella sp. S19_KUP01_CR8 TaxID=3025502 RepID=UPI002FCDAA80
MKKILLFLFLALAIGFIACSSFPAKGVTFSVKNVGKETIASLVVHVTGNSYAIGDIEPGSSKTVVLSPTSESHVELTFAGSPGLKIDCYFERGYSGTLATEITVEKVVAVKDSIVPG